MTTIPNNLTIKVIPRSKKTEIGGMMSDGSLKIRIRAIPEDGKANVELCGYLHEIYGGDWDVISGQTSTRKRVRRRGI